MTVFFVLCLPLFLMGSESDKRTSHVNPFIGTGGHGHTYPGASLPFGMVQLSPDTRLTGWDGCSGYHYSDSVVYGFSHTHLSGTGVSDYGDILFMPMTGSLNLQNGEKESSDNSYASRFSKDKEIASPGYYSVFLKDDKIQAELTVTLRAGMHRYTFPKTNSAFIIIDLVHRDPVMESSIRIVSDTEIEGMRRSRAWAEDQVVYFAARFSKPFLRKGIAVEDKVIPNLLKAEGKHLKGFVQFKTNPGEAIIVKVSISAVSFEGAHRNLDAEISHWDFDSVRKEADRIWEQALGKIQIDGSTQSQKTVFYTALYHAMLCPNLFMDVDGRYRSTDLKIHQSNDFKNYTVFSLWDTYRAAHPLFTLIEQKRTVDFIKTFLAHFEHGRRLPMWELAANYTGCMIGYHAVPVIADAYLKGIRDYNVLKVIPALFQAAEEDRLGKSEYRKYGYIPMDKESESVSKTLEYAYDDWCIAQMVKELGDSHEYFKYIRRSQSYKNLFDPSTGFMRAKLGGRWVTPFDPREVNFNYTEANAWQYSFYVPQDVEGLMTLMGGEEAFIQRLDQLFTEDSQTSGRQQADITGLIGQYAHGNEPSHHMAYLYSFAGQPWKTQERVRQILDTQYTDQPDGLCGNEDCGQMSAWYVFSAMGFYPVTPGDTTYIIGSPLFPKTILHLESGKTFTVRSDQVSSQNKYVQSAVLNGETYVRSFISHQKIMKGGELVFQMGPNPNTKWGNQENRPRSIIKDYPIQIVPFVAQGERTFTDSTRIALASVTLDVKIHYTLDRSIPNHSSKVFDSPFILKKSTLLKAVAIGPRGASQILIAEFSKIPKEYNVQYISPYSTQYIGGGDRGLIDTLRGGNDFRTGYWQGFRSDFEVIVDLGKVQTISQIGAGFLQDIGSWIFMPAKIEFSTSLDGENYQAVQTLETGIPIDQYGPIMKDVIVSCLNKKVRYVKVWAKNFGVLPKWHLGAGGQAWIFVDEIVIK